MVLTDKEIREYSQREENPLIAPFCEDQVQGASYDVKLSGQIVSFKKGVQTIDLSEQETQSVFDLYEKHDTEDEGYILQPNEYILVQLQEALVMPDNWIAHIRPRTRFTKIGLMVADQHCNPSYAGTLYLGVFNASPNALKLKRGLIIAQLVFEQLSETPSKSKLYKNKENAAYMNEFSFRGIVMGEKGWSSAAQDMYDEILRSLKKG